MLKATTIKEAFKKWEEKHPGENISKATDVQLQFQFPPIEKMDNSISMLTNCQLSKIMSKGTTIKEAIKRWEEKHPGEEIGKATEIGFQFQFPPVEKMDNSLAALVSCTKLSLSTNMIEKIAGVSSLKNLKILSLGRNYIKNLSGLEGVAETLEQLWISYNFIEKVKGIGVLKKLKVLYMSNNLVKDWSEFNKLQELPQLEDLLFVGNPLFDALDENVWKTEASKRLPNLKKLDGETVLREEAD